MEVAQVLRMKGGNGDTSYAQNSQFQKNVLFQTKAIDEETIRNLYCNNSPATLRIADLGCSSGPNAFFVAIEVVPAVLDTLRKERGLRLPEIQVFLNDLPGNDFNALFKSWPQFQNDFQKTTGAGAESCFLAGVPGSFYTRLSPRKSLNFVHSCTSLHWLSQVPQGLESNKGNICIASSSPSSVVKAYYQQFQTDFSMFLRCRSEELVKGGSMVLTLLGRRSEDPTSKECCYLCELVAMALNDTVAAGLIDKEKMDSFNLPFYSPSPAEVKQKVGKEGSFIINRMEVFEVRWIANDQGEFCPSDAHNDSADNATKRIRAVLESTLISHFGDGIIEEVFSRLKNIVANHLSKKKTQTVNLTVSMTKCG